MDRVVKFLTLANAAIEIAESDIGWEDKYDLIYSDYIMSKIRETGIELDYCESDSSYEEDVMTYVNALKEKVASFGGIKAYLAKVHDLDSFEQKQGLNPDELLSEEEQTMLKQVQATDAYKVLKEKGFTDKQILSFYSVLGPGGPYCGKCWDKEPYCCYDTKF